MPLELTYAAQKEWKSLEKWSHVYSDSISTPQRAPKGVKQSRGELAHQDSTLHSPALCEIYGKGTAAAKALLRTQTLSAEPGNILVIGSGICDLPNALCDVFRTVVKVYWLSLGFKSHKKLHTKVELIESVPKVDFDICIDNGDLDTRCFLANLGDVSDRIQEELSFARQLIIVTVAHDAILKDMMKVLQNADDRSVRVIRSLPAFPNNTNFVPFAITFSITKKNAGATEKSAADVDGALEAKGAKEIDMQDTAAAAAEVELPKSHVFVRQPVNIDNRWTFREGHMHILRLPRVVKEWRMESFIRRIVPTHQPGVLRHFDIVDEEGKVSYSISMYDRRLNKTPVKTIRQLKPCVAVMVPLADDHHWLYRTVTGHQRLAEKAGTKRVLCVFLPSFANSRLEENINSAQIVEQIRKDIGSHLIQLNSDPKKPVLLMTQQEKFEDERQRVASKSSDLQGQILVYDVVVDLHDEEFKEDPEADTEYHNLEPSEFTRRTLIMESNPRVAQTEVWYTREEGGEPEFVFTHICHSYQIPILEVVLTTLAHKNARAKGALLGTGGGLLYSLFKTVFADDVQLECVELDQTIVDLAVDYFGYTNKEKTIVKNALDYVKENSKSEDKLDFLVVDINGSLGVTYLGLDDVTGPHRDFLQTEFLFDAASCVSDLGCVIFNSVCQTPEARRALGRHLKSHFPRVVSAVYSDELNVIYVCYGEGSTHLNDCLVGLRKKILESAKKYPILQEVVDRTPLYLGAKSKNVLNVLQHAS